MNDRIKLAEAMGWKFEEVDHEYRYCYKRPDGHRDAFRIKEAYDTVIPDPENDANDDYAVLEWARDYTELTPLGSVSWPILDVMGGALQINYQIGDYARAALKVIE